METFSRYFPEHIVALVGGLLLFFLPVNLNKGEMTLSWKDGVEGIEWGTLLLFGGGLAMLPMIYQSIQQFGFMSVTEFSDLLAAIKAVPDSN